MLPSANRYYTGWLATVVCLSDLKVAAFRADVCAAGHSKNASLAAVSNRQSIA
jgi:hypothetical protein